jgi:hypothetical protein
MANRKGSTKPRLSNAPLKGKSRIDEVLPWLKDIGQELLPWQEHVLTDMLKVDKNGMFIRKTNLLLIARQSGKTHLARIRILAGLFLFGEKSIIAMSSNRAMALDTFRKVCDVIEATPQLRTQLKQIRVANGQESIELLNGARYEIVAATRDGSRGKTADLLFVDELREIPEEAWTAARPITRARANSQILLTSNAGDAFSTVLNGLRERANSYPPKSLGYWEYSAPDFASIHDKVFAIDVSVTKRDASLVAGQLREDGTVAVGVIAQFHSDQQVDELKIAVEVNEWARKYRPRLICFDKYTSMTIAERLSLSGQKCQDMSGLVFYQACSDLLESIVNRRLVHNGQASLVDSINSCAAKETDAGWRIVRRKSAGDVSAAIALAMVVHQLNKPQTKPQIIAV